MNDKFDSAGYTDEKSGTINGNGQENVSRLVHMEALKAVSVETGEYVNIKSPEAILVFAFALAAAALYSVCFTGVKVFPQLSLFVFMTVSVVMLYVVLRKLSYLENKKAFRWAVPVIIVSSYNAVFHLNFFSYANVLAIHLMFAALAFSAVRGVDNNLSNLSGWINLLKVILGNFVAPFRIFQLFFKSRKEKRSNVLARVAIGVVLAIPVLIVLTVILMDADAVFGVIMNKIIKSAVVANENIFGHIAAISIVAIYLTGYIYNLKNLKPSKTDLPQFKIDVVIGSTFLSLINILFLFFCVIQTAFLFTGGYMSLPEGIVYSAYAREGFFQLLFVTVINFGVLLIFLKLFPECVKSKLVKSLIIMLCIFTGILILSSFYRMFLYIDAYGFTDIRMMVITFLFMETVLIAVTLRYLYKPNFDFLKIYIYIAVAFYILVNITSSAYVVGRLNINRFYAGKDLDIVPLCRSAETAGLLAEVFESDEFSIRLTDDQTRAAYDALVQFSQTDDNRWQNISIVSRLGVRRAKEILITLPSYSG